jgi:hypothetical protein
MPEEQTATEQAKSTEEAVDTAKALENFEWDDGSSNFFGVEGTAEVKIDEAAEVIAEVKKEEEIAEKEEVEEKEDSSFFDIEKDDKGEVIEKASTETEEEDYYKSLSSKMKENGIFQNVEIPEDEEITEDKFIELQDSEIESRVDEAIESFMGELDEDGAAFLKFKKEGGATSEFFKTYGQSTSVPQGDLDDEVYQEKLARHNYSAVDGDDAEDIDDKIQWLKDSGKLEKYAERFDGKMKEQEKASKVSIQENAKAQAKANDDSRKAFTDNVRETLDATDQVDGYKFTAQRKKTLLPFITKNTVKVGKNKYITGMQSKLQTALKTPEKMLVLAQLLQNDFDVSSLIADANTKVTKKLKTDIQRQKKGANLKGSGRTNKKRSLSDIDF